MKFLVLSLTLLYSGCIYLKKNNSHTSSSSESFHFFELKEDENLGSFEGSPVPYGGFSGLKFIGRDQTTDSPEFYTLTDRGPNAEAIETKNGNTKRPFLNPLFQPMILKIRAHLPTKSIQILDKIPLFIKHQVPFSGRPNISPQMAISKKFQDEIPISMNGEKLDYDLMGIDPESIAIDNNNRFWIGEEYRPSILVFDNKGIMIKRLIPARSFEPKLFIQKCQLNKDQVLDSLPEAYKFRKLNRGFEALGYYNKKIFVMTQSPLEPTNTINKNIIRILVLDSNTFFPIAEYLYSIDHNKADKIGDLVMLSETEFLVIEQNGKLKNKPVFHIYKVDLSQATNVLNMSPYPEQIDQEKLKLSTQFVKKTFIKDLFASGFNFAEKIEGLTLTEKNELVLVNDNDFSLENNKLKPNKKTMLGIFSK